MIGGVASLSGPARRIPPRGGERVEDLLVQPFVPELCKSTMAAFGGDPKRTLFVSRDGCGRDIAAADDARGPPGWPRSKSMRRISPAAILSGAG